MIKTALLTPVLGLFLLHSAAAQKCNLDVDKTDLYTKERLRSGTTNIAPPLYHWKLTLLRSGDKFGWKMQIKWGMHLQQGLDQNSVLALRLEDGTVINLVPDKLYEPSHTVSSAGVISTMYPQGNLTEEQVQSMASSRVAGIRVELGGRDVEPRVSAKQGGSVMATARCLVY